VNDQSQDPRPKRYVPYPNGSSELPPRKNTGPRLDPATFNGAYGEGLGFMADGTCIGRRAPKGVGTNPAYKEEDMDHGAAIATPDDLNLY